MNRILVVDDETALRETVAAATAMPSTRPRMGPKPCIRSITTDLILSELRMPELDGPHLYDPIYQRSRSAMPTVAFMTGHVGDSVDGGAQP